MNNFGYFLKILWKQTTDEFTKCYCSVLKNDIKFIRSAFATSGNTKAIYANVVTDFLAISISTSVA